MEEASNWIMWRRDDYKKNINCDNYFHFVKCCGKETEFGSSKKCLSLYVT